MKSNLGIEDRATRLLLVNILLALYSLEIIQETYFVAVVVGCAYLLLSALFSRCVIYSLLGINMEESNNI